MHHAEDQHQHRRHQVDRDRAGPARNEIAGITQHGFGGRHRSGTAPARRAAAPEFCRRPPTSEAACAAIELSTLPTTAVCRSARSAVRPPAAGAMKPDDSDVAARFTAGATEVCCKIGDHAHQRQRLRREGVAARRDRPAVGNQLAHLREMLAALLEQRRDALAGRLDFLTETVELPGHLRQKLHHGAGAGGAGERAGALGVGQLGEARRGELDIRQQALRRDGVAVGGIEIAGVVLHRDREMLLDRGGAGQRRGVEP